MTNTTSSILNLYFKIKSITWKWPLFLNHKLKITGKKNHQNMTKTLYFWFILDFQHIFVPRYPVKSDGKIVKFHFEFFTWQKTNNFIFSAFVFVFGLKKTVDEGNYEGLLPQIKEKQFFTLLAIFGTSALFGVVFSGIYLKLMQLYTKPLIYIGIFGEISFFFLKWYNPFDSNYCIFFSQVISMINQFNLCVLSIQITFNNSRNFFKIIWAWRVIWLKEH